MSSVSHRHVWARIRGRPVDRVKMHCEMTSQLIALCFDANDPLRLARFWTEALRWMVGDEADDVVSLVPTDGTSFGIDFALVPEQKAGKNRIHLDLTSTSIDD